MKYSKPKEEEYIQIIKEINNSPNIVNWNVSEIKHLEESSSDIIKYLFDKNHNLVGLYVIKKLNIRYIEIAVILVLEEYRDLGYGYRLLMNCLNDCKNYNSNIYTVSRNPVVTKWLKQENFNRIPLIKLPKEIFFTLIKSKLKWYKLGSGIKKGLQSGWEYYIKEI